MLLANAMGGVKEKSSAVGHLPAIVISRLSPRRTSHETRSLLIGEACHFFVTHSVLFLEQPTVDLDRDDLLAALEASTG